MWELGLKQLLFIPPPKKKDEALCQHWFDIAHSDIEYHRMIDINSGPIHQRDGKTNESDELLIKKTKQLQITFKIICWSFYFRPLKSFYPQFVPLKFSEKKSRASIFVGSASWHHPDEAVGWPAARRQVPPTCRKSRSVHRPGSWNAETWERVKRVSGPWWAAKILGGIPVFAPPPPKINMFPLKRDHFWKGHVIFQPSIFRGYLSFQGH